MTKSPPRHDGGRARVLLCGTGALAALEFFGDGFANNRKAVFAFLFNRVEAPDGAFPKRDPQRFVPEFFAGQAQFSRSIVFTVLTV